MEHKQHLQHILFDCKWETPLPRLWLIETQRCTLRLTVLVLTLYNFANGFGMFAWASCQIRKIKGCACAENAGSVFSADLKPLVSKPGIHHATCIAHVPWCMSGSLSRGGRRNVSGIFGACATLNFTYLIGGPCTSVRLLVGTVVPWNTAF